MPNNLSADKASHVKINAVWGNRLQRPSAFDLGSGLWRMKPPCSREHLVLCHGASTQPNEAVCQQVWEGNLRAERLDQLQISQLWFHLVTLKLSWCSECETAPSNDARMLQSSCLKLLGQSFNPPISSVFASGCWNWQYRTRAQLNSFP